MNNKPYSVTAGKHDDQERNYKYCDSFDTLDEALDAYKKVASYPWAVVHHKGCMIDVWESGLGNRQQDQ